MTQEGSSVSDLNNHYIYSSENEHSSIKFFKDSEDDEAKNNQMKY